MDHQSEIIVISMTDWAHTVLNEGKPYYRYGCTGGNTAPALQSAWHDLEKLAGTRNRDKDRRKETVNHSRET